MPIRVLFIFNLCSESDTVCCMPNHAGLADQFFFLEHAGELCIIVLIEEKESYIDPNTHTPTKPART
jgi:hypothetical protein